LGFSLNDNAMQVLMDQLQALTFGRPLKRTTLVLWLYQRHALKAFRASVGKEDGHNDFRGFCLENLIIALLKIAPVYPYLITPQ
jgi:hypothetical protein